MPAIARDIAEQRLLEPADLIRIDAPTLVVVGDRDPFVPVDQAWALKRQLPDARLLVAPDCGHEVPMKRTGTVQRGGRGLLPVDGGGRHAARGRRPPDPPDPADPAGHRRSGGGRDLLGQGRAEQQRVVAAVGTVHVDEPGLAAREGAGRAGLVPR